MWMLSGPPSGFNYLHEFIIVDLAVTVHIGFADHLINLVVSQLLPYKLCDNFVSEDPRNTTMNAYRGLS